MVRFSVVVGEPILRSPFSKHLRMSWFSKNLFFILSLHALSHFIKISGRNPSCPSDGVHNVRREQAVPRKEAKRGEEDNMGFHFLSLFLSPRS